MPTVEFEPVRAAPAAPTVLTEVSDHKTTVQYLRRTTKLTEPELSAVIGADERTIRRWASAADDAQPQPRFAERLDDLRDLVMLLAASLPGEQTGRWLRARNRVLAGERPLQLVTDGKYDAVRDAAEAFIDGDPL